MSASLRCMVADAGSADLELAMSVLPEERARKASSYIFERDRRLSAVAGLFMEALRLCRGVDIVVDGNGKPLSADGSVHFNASHSGRYVAFAVSDVPVGIDIEQHGDGLDLLGSVSTQAERLEYSRIPEGSREELFYRMWTAKESYMKAVGLGMSLPPETFAVVADGGITDRMLPEPYRIAELAAPDGYSASVCLAGNPGKPRLVEVDADSMASLISV